MYPDARDHIWGPDSAISLACDLELGDYVHICDLGGNTITGEFQSGSDAVAQSPGDSGILCAKVTQSIPILHPHMLARRFYSLLWGARNCSPSLSPTPWQVCHG